MRRNIFVIVVVLLTVIFCLSGCSSWKAPKEGQWYCEELKIAIDFSYIYENRTPNAAKLYAEDGSYIDILCYIDYGTGLFLTSQDGEINYLAGEFSWKNDKLTVTSYDDDSVYTFIKMLPPSPDELR